MTTASHPSVPPSSTPRRDALDGLRQDLRCIEEDVRYTQHLTTQLMLAHAVAFERATGRIRLATAASGLTAGLTAVIFAGLTSVPATRAMAASLGIGAMASLAIHLTFRSSVAREQLARRYDDGRTS